jgi:hypothetical protein
MVEHIIRPNRHSNPSYHGSKRWPKSTATVKVWPRPKRVIVESKTTLISAGWKELTESELAKISINPDEENANAERQNSSMPEVQGT